MKILGNGKRYEDKEYCLLPPNVWEDFAQIYGGVEGGGVSYMGNNDQIMQGKVLQMHFPVIWTV